MKSLKPRKVKKVEALVKLRPRIDEEVGSKADILGSMIGYKIKNGKLTETLVITYLVKEKLPKKEIQTRKRIPSTIEVDGVEVLTDVIAWPRMEEQNPPEGTLLLDERLQGTLTCFGVSQFGRYGVSCAHCLTGNDRNPSTPTSVSAFFPPMKKFLSVGESVYLAYSPGQGRPNNFGYLDCGLFDLRDDWLAQRAALSRPLQLVNDIRNLAGQRLIGISALRVPNSNDQTRLADVIGIEAGALGERCDLVLSVLSPGTFRGDSGMLWLTQDGKAAAIHARGEVMIGISGSNLTTAMSAKRAENALGVKFFIG